MKKAKKVKRESTPTEIMEAQLEELFDLVPEDERISTIIITDEEEDDDYEEPPNGFWW